MVNQIFKIVSRFSNLNYQSRLLIVLVILLLPILIIYGAFLERTPVHLNQDELGFALNAYSIAKTGFDENGRFFPLYFWHLGVMWSTPIIVYLTALILRILSLSETTIRLPSIFVGLVDIVLIGFLAAKIFKDIRYGILGALFLAVTPVHFIHSRLLLDNLFIVPFVLGWLLCLYLFLEKRNPWFLGLAAFLLGLGFHSYHAAKVMIPLYILMTFWVLGRQLKENKKLILFIIVPFLIPLLPVIPWLSKYPDTFIDQVKYTGLYDTGLNPLAGLFSLLNPGSILHRLDVFFAYFNPYFLFFRGDESLIHSTQRTGVFLLSFAIFIPAGMYSVLRSKTPFNLLLVLGFFSSPIAAALVGDHYRISRALVMLPFATLLAVYGVQLLLSTKNNLLHVTCYLLLITLPLQFSYFVFDYFKDYRIRSYSWFRYNIPAALEAVIDEDTKRPLYAINLDDRIDFIDRYWRFFLIKHNREDLLEKTYYFDPYFSDLKSFPKNSLLLYNFDHVGNADNKKDSFRKTKDIFEPDGTSRFYIYRN